MPAVVRMRSVLALALGFASACVLFTDLSGLDDGQASRDAGAEGAIGIDAPLVDAATDGAEASIIIDACASIDLTSDPEHCGTCGRSCFGGACKAATCLPVSIVTGLPPSIGLAVARGKLYVGTPGAIRQYSLDGGAPLDIAVSPGPRYITADDTYLYWADANNGTVMRWPLGGGSAEVLATNAAPSGVAVSSEHVYFTHYNTDGGVERIQLDGGGRETVFRFYRLPEDVDFAKGELIVGGDGRNELVVFADAGFGAQRTLSTGNGPVTMTVLGDDVFFVEQQSGNIMRVPLAGGGKELLAVGATVPTGIAGTADSIYWLNLDGGTIKRLAR